MTEIIPFLTEDSIKYKNYLKSIFFDKSMLDTEYLHNLESEYDHWVDTQYFNQFCTKFRNYRILLEALIFMYESQNKNHRSYAKSYAKRLKNGDIETSESVFTEIIVHCFYLKLLDEGIIQSVDIIENQCDLIVKTAKQENYLEIISISPQLTEKCKNLSLHIYDKILKKILEKSGKTNQLIKPRINFLVIESINSIINTQWFEPLFRHSITQNIKGIILFKNGEYQSREISLNKNFKGNTNVNNIINIIGDVGSQEKHNHRKNQIIKEIWELK